MQSEDELCAQIPPPIEELDQLMGATQLSNNDDEKTAPPSPSLVPKKMHLLPLVQVPYPWTFWLLRSL